MIKQRLSEIWIDLRAIIGLELLALAIKVLPNSPLRRRILPAATQGVAEDVEALARKVM